MHVLISGSTGLVGTELVDYLKRKGHHPLRLVRRKGPFAEPQIVWNPETGQLNPAELEGIDAVIHLAGENIAAGRWTEARKRKIMESRVKGTQLLAETLARLNNPPSVFISASAIGIYGDRGDTVLTEVSGAGRGFLAETCKRWEAAAQPAKDKGIRVAHARFGIILTPNGGALKAMYWPFRLGLAGNLGNGQQYISWIALADAVGALEYMLTHPQIQGPVNVVAPNPVTNARFTSVMRQVLVPSFLPMHYWTPPAPALAVEMLMGEMGRELLLASARVQPVVLEETGYPFRFSELKPALNSML